MEVVANNYMSGDPRLVDQIVYELKSQGIFDKFRKECLSDVDTKPAYQNLRQRVEGSVASFLRQQKWKPDMNKNQVREMLRKNIYESGFLETGVERIVDQVVNPKINTMFLPQVEEVVYKFFGVEKPNRNETKNESLKLEISTEDLLPKDLEAVSPESESNEKKEDDSINTDDTKMEEDESPPFEPLEEKSSNLLLQEENSVDSHMSGFSGLASHESNHSSDTKGLQIDLSNQDSQMSRNSSESRLSIVTSDDNMKIDTGGDDLTIKSQKDAKKSNKSVEKSKSRSEKERKSSSSKTSSSRDKERSHKDSKSSNRTEKDRHRSKHSTGDRNKDEKIREKSKSSSSSASKSRSSHSDSKSKSKRTENKHSSSYSRHSSSSSNTSTSKRDKKDQKKDKDDHYSSKEKKNDRRSTDRDSNDGQASKNPSTSNQNDNLTKNSLKSTNEQHESSSNTGQSEDSGQSDSVQTKTPVEVEVNDNEIAISSQKVKLNKPKFASNIREAMKLMKIRKQLTKLEKQNHLSVLNSEMKEKNGGGSCENDEKTSTVLTKENWDALEARLYEEMSNISNSYGDTSDERSDNEDFLIEDNNSCQYLEKTEENVVKEKEYLDEYVEKLEKNIEAKLNDTKINKKRKSQEQADVKNNNKLNEDDGNVKKRPKRKSTTSISDVINDSFSLPLSPAESDASSDKKEEASESTTRPKRSTNRGNLWANQRYSSDDLYKPRSTFTSSRRRGAKNIDN